MNISENGINLIANFEGCRLEAYKCPANVVTIGIGETGKFALTGKTIVMGMKITKQQANDSFRIAIKNYENAVNKLGVKMNQNVYDALVSFCFNLGTGIFKNSLLDSIKTEKWDDVARQMLLYNKARVNGNLTVLAGLTRRRKAEADLLLTPVKQEVINDNDLSSAVSKIIKSGISINYDQWKRVDLINLKNVPALLQKLGGLDKLVSNKVIGNRDLWTSNKYTLDNVRSLLIKFANSIK